MVRGAVAERVRALDWRPGGPGFESWACRILLRQLPFGTLAISLPRFASVFSEETLKAVGPLYLLSMTGEVKHPTQG